MPIIREVPDARYLILNAANSTQLDDEEVALFRQADVVMDTSGRATNRLGELLSTYGKDKFAVGIHAPILDYLTGLLRIESLKDDEADAETKKLLRSGNVKRILRL